MNLNDSPEDQSFRADVRSWLNDTFPAAFAAKAAAGHRFTKEDYLHWHALIRAKGWLAWNWPTEYGGAAWTPMQKYIFEEETIALGAPRVVPFGLSMLGPVLVRFGTPEQKETLLPRILNDQDWWAQGFSEPGAGSDLASLKTSARRDGDDYIVNGQKIWTTQGHYANKYFCLVRTSTEGKKQAGISFLLIDRDSPGVEVKPIITLDGEHEVNEIWFTDVRVPVSNLVGAPGGGWDIAKYLLTFERTNHTMLGFTKAAIARLRALAEGTATGHAPLMDDPAFALQLAELDIEAMALEVNLMRILTDVSFAAAASSLAKLKGVQLYQRSTDLMRKAVGPYALPFVPEAMSGDWNEEPIGPRIANSVTPHYLNMRKMSIAGGSNEVLRGIVAKTILGL
jgi:alkylation response protein AidB-like acyl-CoA dehydrogenase